MYERLVSFFMSVGPWVSDHPLFASVVFWPIVTAIVTWLFKPRTPEEYVALAATKPRTAKFLRLIGALGLDAPKVLQVLGDMAKRKPPGGLGILPLVLAIALLAAANQGCTPDGRLALIEEVTNIGTCVIGNQGLPDEVWIAKCGVKALDVDRFKRIVAESRAATARASAAQREVDAKVGICKPEKLSSP